MSRVFVARDESLGRDIVVKVLAPELTEGLSAERFAREIRLAARLQHPLIVPVLAAGTMADGLPFYTMPFVEGESLRHRLERGALPIAESVSVLRDVARALGYAHGRGVVHRDIKPENILLTGGAAVVCDFGVAKALRSASLAPTQPTTTAELTRLGLVVGTPAYLSPEQAAGDPDVDARADIYAWGLLAWECIAGQHPFAGRRSSRAYVTAHLAETPPNLATAVPGVPASLAALVMQCLEKAPEDRPPDASALLSLFEGAQTSGIVRESSREHQTSRTPLPAVAVLPFANLSSDPENEYLSDGITDEIIGTLGRLGGVRVAGRASSFALKGQALDPRAVGERLGVAAVLEGSVRRAGSRLRVRAQLVGAADGFQLWSEQYDREVADVFALELDIAQSIVDALRSTLTGLITPDSAAPAAPAVDPEAYELYLRGRFAWNQRTAPAAADAVRFLSQAVARAPTFSRAWSALADAYLALPVYTGTSPAEGWRNARAACERAIELDPDSAEAHTSLAYGMMIYDWDWDSAERSFRRAIAANPEYSTAHHWYADFLAGRGRLDEALREIERARSLDPLSRMVSAERAWMLGLLRRDDEALAQIDDVLRLDPNFAHAHFIRGLLLATRTEYASAIAELRRSLELGGFYGHAFGALGYAVAASGDHVEATRLIDELRARVEREHVPPFAVALAYAGFRDLDSVFVWLERGIEEHDELLAENFCDPLFDEVRRDPRCGPILSRLHISSPLPRG